MPTNAENTLSKLAEETRADTIFMCRKCWSLFENEQLQDAFDCPNCSTDEIKVTLYAEPLTAWMRAQCSKKTRVISDEAREKIRQGARQPHPRGAQSPEAKARMGGFNYKHGLTAKIRPLPRASHGNLAACKSCPYASSSINPSGDGRCLSQKWTECAYQGVELFAFAQALATKNLDDIKSIVGDVQAQQLFTLKMAIQDVIAQGVTIEEITERNFGDKGSTTETKVKLNPALEAVSILSRSLGGIGLQDFLLTPKSGSEDLMKRSLADDLALLFQPYKQQPQLNPDDFQPAEVEPSPA